MIPDQHEPVLIVGAGPTGMVLANELLRRRVPCRMIDKISGPSSTFPKGLSCYPVRPVAML